MKTIASLSGPEFLRACNKLRYVAEGLMRRTHVLDIRKVMPTIPDEATEEERKALIEEQSRKNISDMLDCLLDKCPEDTYKFLRAFIVDNGEGEPDGMDLMCAAMEILTNQKVVDFLLSLMKLVLPNTDT